MLLEVEEAELLGAAVVELGAAELVPFISVALLELEAAGAALGSLVVEGAAVGFAWLDVWSVVAGVVEVWPVLALGAVLLWLELAEGV